MAASLKRDSISESSEVTQALAESNAASIPTQETHVKSSLSAGHIRPLLPPRALCDEEPRSSLRHVTVARRASLKSSSSHLTIHVGRSLIQLLPDDLIVYIFNFIEKPFLLEIIPFVCRQWKKLAYTSTLWLSIPAIPSLCTPSLLLPLLKQLHSPGPNVQSLALCDDLFLTPRQLALLVHDLSGSLKELSVGRMYPGDVALAAFVDSCSKLQQLSLMLDEDYPLLGVYVSAHSDRSLSSRGRKIEALNAAALYMAEQGEQNFPRLGTIEDCGYDQERLIETICKAHSLTTLYISGAVVSVTVAVQLCQNLSSLKAVELWLDLDNVTSPVAIVGCEKLERVTFHLAPYSREDDIVAFVFAECPKLSYVRLETIPAHPFPIGVVPAFLDCPALEEVHIAAELGLSYAMFEKPTTMALKSLSLDCRVLTTGEGRGVLESVPHTLRKLQLGSYSDQIHPESINHLCRAINTFGRLPHLTHLEISQLRFPSAVISIQHVALQIFELTGCFFESKSELHLIAPSLIKFHIHVANDHGALPVVRLACPRLKRLHVNGGDFANDGWLHGIFDRCPLLEEAIFGNCERFVSPQITSALCPRLTFIKFDSCSNLTLPKVSSRRLTCLAFLNCPIVQRVANRISPRTLPKLQALALIECPRVHRFRLTSSTLLYVDLNHCLQLTDLTLDSPALLHIDIDGCSSLKRGEICAPRLRILKGDSSRISRVLQQPRTTPVPSRKNSWPVPEVQQKITNSRKDRLTSSPNISSASAAQSAAAAAAASSSALQWETGFLYGMLALSVTLVAVSASFLLKHTRW
mmetsp:Transcript_35475/g.57385  ORF Transcript_35475/g.57385 Transcript_35475/m.57385 type:complete len:807 (+) Transcript_35475:188-2608(+)|eukprot:CAMPEP_0184672416 /NCGR_PEP_ID=MMETSP0308-20130426/86084_1 /TAXON_ID=38269 /ORGANISM="Gloeochaete witrockiana, Strain SAG 46.84" /LENGTH=806 /DNA_ID=CAMNT_0027119739 /DNA_START=158 /DNA_END=2578 /DNA_ORIENTATION=+